MALSPMMQQYMEIKENYKDCILLFRLGDFYEMFFDDALTCVKELELTLTGKNCGLEERAPMCGIPFHAAETYVGKLVEKGYKVAICEQVEEAGLKKGIVKREVIKVVTPGTISGSTNVNEKDNIYIGAIFLKGDAVGLSFCDVSTGELYGTEIIDDDPIDTLANEIESIGIKEIILTKDTKNLLEERSFLENSKVYINSVSVNVFDIDNSRKIILHQTEKPSIIAYGIENKNHITMAVGGLLSYIKETQMNAMEHINELNIYQIGNQMSLDKATIRNLELVESIFDKTVKGSLLGILDKTQTAMGGRKLKKWIKAPITDSKKIIERLDGVEELVDDFLLRNHIKESLKYIYDFERLIGKIVSGSVNGKDLIAMRNSIGVLPELKNDLECSKSTILNDIYNEIDTLEDVYTLIDNSIFEEPPYTIKEGGLIKEGFSNELDDMKNSIKHAKDWINELEGKEREATGIKNLKVRFNKVFGYYIEITKSAYDMIPEHYIRKQTLVNAERFITSELKDMESLVLNAESKINVLEYEIFSNIKEQIKEYIKIIKATSKGISSLDVITTFAEVANTYGYVRPKITDDGQIVIINGRHPVIENTINGGIFVPNDLEVDSNKSSMMLITGPNMAGKSTYMRQNAIIVLMAQIGCFVPCEKAQIGVCDRIFTRIGASDNLAQGQSTFFVEMSELAYILKNATSKSLVILDEIGRGTSTYDGLSIAWAIVEYLCKKNERVRTLFATHYHELTVLENQVEGFKNLTVDISEENGEIIFLHKIKEGSASKSYGIHVADLAGVPKELLSMAEDKLKELESEKTRSEKQDYQLSFFS